MGVKGVHTNTQKCTVGTYGDRQKRRWFLFIHSFKTLIRAFQLSPRGPKRAVGVGLQGLTVKWEPATDWGSQDLWFKKPLLVFKAFKYHLLSHS